MTRRAERCQVAAARSGGNSEGAAPSSLFTAEAISTRKLSYLTTCSSPQPVDRLVACWTNQDGGRYPKLHAELWLQDALCRDGVSYHCQDDHQPILHLPRKAPCGLTDSQADGPALLGQFRTRLLTDISQMLVGSLRRGRGRRANVQDGAAGRYSEEAIPVYAR